MPNRLIYNQNPENVKTQIYGSDLSQPVEVVDGAISVTGTFSVNTETPLSVSVLSLPEITVANELTVASLPEVTVANELTISSLPPVELSGTPTVAIDQPLEVCVLELPAVALAVEVINELTIASLPAIELSGTPTVVFDQPVEVTTGTSNFAVQLAARTVTADVNSYAFDAISRNSTTTPVYYVAELRDFGYMIFSTATSVTAEVYASPVPTGIPAVSLGGPEALSTSGVKLPQDYVTGAYLTNLEYSQYSYVIISVSTLTPVTVDVYFQGQI